MILHTSTHVLLGGNDCLKDKTPVCRTEFDFKIVSSAQVVFNWAGNQLSCLVWTRRFASRGRSRRRSQTGNLAPFSIENVSSVPLYKFEHGLQSKQTGWNMTTSLLPFDFSVVCVVLRDTTLCPPDVTMSSLFYFSGDSNLLGAPLILIRSKLR